MNRVKAASFSTYVHDDLPTPKTGRWVIDMGIESDYSASMSVATMKMNLRQAQLLQQFKVAASQKAQAFVTQHGQELSEELEIRGHSPTSANASVVSHLLECLRQAREMVDLELNIGQTVSVSTPNQPAASLIGNGVLLQPHGGQRALLLQPSMGASPHGRLGHFLPKDAGREPGFLPELKPSMKGIGRSRATRIHTPQPDMEATLAMLPDDLYSESEVFTRPRSTKADRGLIEQNITVAKDWHAIRQTMQAEHAKKTKERQQVTRERFNSIQEKALQEVIAKQEKKSSASQKVLMAQRDADYAASLKWWCKTVTALGWLVRLSNNFEEGLQRHHTRSRFGWATQILSTKFLWYYRAYLRRRVLKAFPPGSNRRLVITQWIRRSALRLRNAATSKIISFLKGPVHVLKMYSIMRKLKSQVIACQSLWRMKLAQAQVRILFVERSFIVMENCIIAMRDSRILADVRFLAAVKHQLLCMQKGVCTPQGAPWRDECWPLPTPKLDQIEDEVSGFLKTYPIKQLAATELTLRRSRLTVLAENAAYKLSNTDLHGSLIAMGILTMVQPTSPMLRASIVSRAISARRRGSPIQRSTVGFDSSVSISFDSETDLVPMASTRCLPVQLMFDNEDLAALVRKGLLAVNPCLRSGPASSLAYQNSPRKAGKPVLPPFTVYFKDTLTANKGR